MAKTIDLEAAHELACDLAGSLEHLGLMHAALAAATTYSREHVLLAATFSTLRGSAERIAELIDLATKAGVPGARPAQ